MMHHALRQSVDLLPLLLVVFVIRELPDDLRPCHHERTASGVTVIFYDPRSTPDQVVPWSIENLSHAERDVIRRAQGVGPVGTPLPEAYFERLTLVPESMLYQPETLGGLLTS